MLVFEGLALKVKVWWLILYLIFIYNSYLYYILYHLISFRLVSIFFCLAFIYHFIYHFIFIYLILFIVIMLFRWIVLYFIIFYIFYILYAVILEMWKLNSKPEAIQRCKARINLINKKINYLIKIHIMDDYNESVIETISIIMLVLMKFSFLHIMHALINEIIIIYKLP